MQFSITAAAVDYFSKLWTNSNCKFIILATVHLFTMLLGCPTRGDCKINEIQAFTSWLKLTCFANADEVHL